MQYRVGQRVRFLHESGEGIIVRLIDNKHVEVDLGDDFPMDMHVNELVPVDRSEDKYLPKEHETAIPAKTKDIRPLGISLLELSLVVVPKDRDEFEFWLINPEPTEMLYTCYVKNRSGYLGMGSGQLDSGERKLLFRLPAEEVLVMKALQFQWLSFQPGKSHPHQPLGREIAWSKARLREPSKFLTAVDGDAWTFSLRVDQQLIDVKEIKDSEFIRIRKEDAPTQRLEPEVDLHIESLVDNPHELAPSEMLRIQLDFLKQTLSDALEHNYAGLILIHGVGQGTLKSEVRQILKTLPQVKEFSPADPIRYGNGATKVVFR